MKMKTVITSASSMVLLFSLAIPAFAQSDKVSDYVVSNEAIGFLQAHNVDVSSFKKSNTTNNKVYSTENPSTGILRTDLYDEEILSLERQASAYNFTDDQIQSYVEGIINTTPTVINTANSASPLSTPYSSRIDPHGIGYEVKSTSGFYEETAFATIPSAYRGGDNTSGYMFYSVSSPLSGNWGIDVGLWYGAGGDSGDVVGWRGVYNPADAKQEAVPSDGSIISALTPGKQVYLVGQIRSDGYLECKVLDANNFSTVYVDFIYYVGNHGIYASNGIFNRQITLCHGDGIYTNGSYMRNAIFNNAYLYSNTSYAPVTASNTDSSRVGVFGSGGTTTNKVTVNNYTQWGSENININFTNP